MADFDINISDDDRDLIARIVSTEADHTYASSDPDTYNAMVAGIVDTVLNRVASPRFPSTVEAVANQKNQFSAINGPKGRGYEVYESVRRVPEPSSTVRNAVDQWIDARIMGQPSSVGGSLHYANPFFSDDNNQGWIEALTGPRIGAGVSMHYHGTAPGYRSKEATVTGLVRNADSQFLYQDGLGLQTSSGSFLNLAPRLNTGTKTKSVAQSLIGDVPVVVRKLQVEPIRPSSFGRTTRGAQTGMAFEQLQAQFGKSYGTQPLAAPAPLKFPSVIPQIVQPSLRTNTVSTVKINPSTGMPYKTTVSGSASMGAGAGGKASATVTAGRTSPTVPGRRPETPTIASTINGVNSVYQTLLQVTKPLRPKTGLQPQERVSSALPQPGTTWEQLQTEYRLFGGKEPVKKAPVKSTPGVVVQKDFDVTPQGPSRGRGGKRRSYGDSVAAPSPLASPVLVAPMVPARRPDSRVVPGRRVAYTPGTATIPAAAPAPAPAPQPSVLPTYTTTSFQEDRFQTTTGAQMPGSMNNDRWTTGY